MLPLVPIAISLAEKYLPDLVGYLAGDKAEVVARHVVTAAAQATGIDASAPDAGDQILAALEKRPELVEQMQGKIIDLQIAELQEDSKRIESVNTTMRAELASKDPYNSRWRATFGYVCAISFGVQMMGATFFIFVHPEKAAQVITALAGLAGLWAMALAVIGVAVHKRSQDKQTAAGIGGQGLMAGLVKRIGGGNG